MLVSDLEANISNLEYVQWQIFYAKRAQQQEVENKLARR